MYNDVRGICKTLRRAIRIIAAMLDDRTEAFGDGDSEMATRRWRFGDGDSEIRDQHVCSRPSRHL